MTASSTRYVQPRTRRRLLRPTRRGHEPGDPDGQQQRVEEKDLLQHELNRREHDVLAGPLHVLEVLESREVVANLPEDVGQKNQKRDPAPDPDPRFRELAALPGEQQPRQQGAAEKERRVLVLEAQAGATRRTTTQSRELPVRTMRMTQKTQPIQ